jgi:nucleoside 2-deoxyribosyltransferase
MCGKFAITSSLLAGALDHERASLTSMQRAALAHFVRRQSMENRQSVFVLNSMQYGAIREKSRLPTPAAQALYAIAFVGDHMLETGSKLAHPPRGFHAIIGAPNNQLAGDLLVELKKKGWIEGNDRPIAGAESRILQIGLTLDGWERYEAEKKGKLSGKYGFLAMQFNNDTLEEFASKVIKPCVKEVLGIDVVDIREVARAGVIDNILRAQIRDSAFILADLTHDNYGAYWEAGYAEGLGKPVIYLCEKAKFDNMKTHFDTNHSTTVLWTTTEVERFKLELTSTIRRSLDLFAR